MSKRPFFSVGLADVTRDHTYVGRDGKPSLGMTLAEVQAHSDSCAPAMISHAATPAPKPVPRNIIATIQNDGDPATVATWMLKHRGSVNARVAEIERLAPAGMKPVVRKYYAGISTDQAYSRARSELKGLTNKVHVKKC